MHTCDHFEKNYMAWKSGNSTPEETRLFEQHAGECENCRDFNEEIYLLRQQTASIPLAEPSIRFLHQLDNRIREAEETGQKSKAHGRVIPRWAAMGAGLASGLAVGAILLLNPGSGDISETESGLAQVPEMEELIASPQESDSMLNLRDSLNVPEGHYNLNERSQTVSADRR